MNQNKQDFKLTPGYITGLTQTDGSFICSITINTVGLIKFIPVFDITADLTSKYVLEEIQQYFGYGTIRISIKNHTASYQVTKSSDFLNIIIPHFNLYPLFCAKLHAFNLFKLILEGIIKNKAKNKENEWKIEIVKMALSMNTASLRTPERINQIYSNLGILNGANLPLIENKNNTIATPITNDNISGIIDGDGSFWISFSEKGVIKPGFSITTDTATVPLLKKIKEIFNNIGSILKKKSTYSCYYVHGLNQITEIIIPFMDKNPIFSERANHYDIFRKVSLIIKNQRPLTLEAKLEIVELAYNANKSGKRRRITKEDYIELLIKIHSDK